MESQKNDGHGLDRDTPLHSEQGVRANEARIHATEEPSPSPSPVPQASSKVDNHLEVARRQSSEAQDTVQKLPDHDDGQQLAMQTHHERDHKGAPAVRLDMDLDVDVELKAKIQGDITLSILEGDQKGG